MMSSSVGWAFGGEAGEEAILRTTDGGTTWTDVSPVRLGRGAALFHFFGPDHAWFGLPDIARGQRILTVYRTGDAGRTWAKGEVIVLPNDYPPVAVLDPGLQFVDLEHGWVTLVFKASDPASSGVAIYATNDSGQTWPLVSVTLNPPSTSSPNGLPLGCSKTGITFNSPTTGWATAHCADGSLFFYVSHDGGHSWRPQPLPPPAGYPPTLFGNCDCGSLPPRFGTTPTDGALVFQSPDLLYVTHDGGTSWLAVTLPTKYIGASDFIDSQHGWLISLASDPQTHALTFDRLYVTGDGGQSWEPVKADRALTGTLDFINAEVGWFIDRHINPPELYRTGDGGQTWQRLQPRLIGRPTKSA